MSDIYLRFMALLCSLIFTAMGLAILFGHPR